MCVCALMLAHTCLCVFVCKRACACAIETYLSGILSFSYSISKPDIQILLFKRPLVTLPWDHIYKFYIDSINESKLQVTSEEI